MAQIRPWSRPDTRRLTVDGMAVAIEVVRNGPPICTVAWLHGLGGASTLEFATVVRHPALRGVTSLLVDLPGFGLSSRPAGWTYTIEDFAHVAGRAIGEVADTPVTLIGHSMGGAVAIACAHRAVVAVKRLIVVEPSWQPETGRLSAHISSQREERYVTRGHQALLRGTAGAAQVDDPVRTIWAQTLRIASPVAMYRAAVSLQQERAPSFRDMLADLQVPVISIRGELSDAPGHPPEGTQVREFVVANGGHMMFAECPDAFSEIVAGILELPALNPPNP